MNKLILTLLCTLTQFSFAHDDSNPQKITPKWTKKIEMGDGTTYYMNPRLQFQKTTYLIPMGTNFSGGGWENFSSDGFCKLLNYPDQNGFGWAFIPSAKPKGEFPLLAIDADGNFLKKDEKAKNYSATTAIRCYDERKTKTYSSYHINFVKIDSSTIEILGKDTYITLPFEATQGYLDGSLQFKSFNEMRLPFDFTQESDGTELCKIMGYPKLIKINYKESEVESIRLHAQLLNGIPTLMNMYKVNLDSSSFTCSK